LNDNTASIMLAALFFSVDILPFDMIESHGAHEFPVGMF